MHNYAYSYTNIHLFAYAKQVGTRAARPRPTGTRRKAPGSWAARLRSAGPLRWLRARAHRRADTPPLASARVNVVPWVQTRTRLPPAFKHPDKERIHGSWHPYADRSRLILDGHTVELGESSDSNISMLERGWSRDPIATYPLIPSPASSYTPDIQPAEEKVRSDNTANASDDWFNNMPF